MTLPATWRAGLILIAVTIIAAIVLVASPARATDEPKQYLTVAWIIDNPDDIWAPAQHSPVYVVGPAVDFEGLKALVPCGTYSQFDGNNDGDAIRSTIAGGFLYGPNNPGEDLAYDAPGTEATGGTPWMYYTAPDCAETICVDSFTQQTTTYRYAWDGTASVRTDVSAISATLTEADAITAGCYVPPVVDPLPPVTPPDVAELAHAGPVSSWMLYPALLLLGAGFLVLGLHLARRKDA